MTGHLIKVVVKGDQVARKGEGAREAEIGLGAKRAHRKITIRGITTEEFYRVAFPPRGGEGY